MERSAAFTPDASSSSVQAPRSPASGRAPDLPGCESFRLPASALDAYDGGSSSGTADGDGLEGP